MNKLSMITAAALFAAAGTAVADKGDAGFLLSDFGNTGINGTNDVSNYLGRAGTRIIDVAGTDSWDAYGSPNNVRADVQLKPNGHVVGIGWDVTLTAFDPSWRSEIRVDLTDSAITDGIGLAPGAADTSPGGPTAYSSGGIIDLVGAGLDFFVGADGVLSLEFYEGFDDAAGVIDGEWNQGVLTVVWVPAPGAAAVLGLGGLMAVRRRR